jgi:hypothetical protein
LSTNAAREKSTPHTPPRIALLVGAAAGVGISSFGLILPWAAACLVALVAVTLGRNRTLTFLAVGLAAGAVTYVALGLAMNVFDDPSSASGWG